jgi:hypothetical protein
MRSRGIWTLRCQRCRRDFTLEIRPGEHLVDFAKGHTCPHCKIRPNERALGVWHDVVDFRMRSPE